ncbi:hypothetical protein BDZ89DRAFT_1141506 [Hymenopellis radicata]|nr:hypothetical protein BDZ89DRAFT_1141506 [Hymenopellis radicata]
MTLAFREFPLPRDLVEVIVFHISDELANLRVAILICRAFVPVCRKHIYEKIVLLDDTDDAESRNFFYPPRSEYPPVYTEASFLALLKEAPSLGGLVKEIRICGSTRTVRQRNPVESKLLPIILPFFSFLQSISFQRIRPGLLEGQGCIRTQYHLDMLITSRLARAIPPCVQVMELRHVEFQHAKVVDVLFSTCHRLTHLALDHVSILREKRSLKRSVVSATKSFRNSISTAPQPIPLLSSPPVKLQSFVSGSSVDLPRLPFVDHQGESYFSLSSVTSLKLLDSCQLLSESTFHCWKLLITNTASTLQELVISADLCERIWCGLCPHETVIARTTERGTWDLSKHKRLRSLTLIWWTTRSLPKTTALPEHLERLILLACGKRDTWNELDAYINRHPIPASLSHVEIVLHRRLHRHGHECFCWVGWDENMHAEFEECKAEIMNGMPILHDRGLLNVRPYKEAVEDGPFL